MLRPLGQSKGAKTMPTIEEILRELCENAYWYGEQTGDYDMTFIKDEPWYMQALKELNDATTL